MTYQFYLEYFYFNVMKYFLEFPYYYSFLKYLIKFFPYSQIRKFFLKFYLKQKKDLNLIGILLPLRTLFLIRL